MAGISRNWNGHIYGTNTGNVAVSFEGDDAALTGVIRLSDNQHGVAIYDVVGKFDASNLELTGAFRGEVADGASVGELSIKGSLTPEGRLDGEWSSTIGTGGTFRLWPFETVPSTASVTSAVPEQLNSSSRSLGAVRLNANEVRALIRQLTKDFSHKRAVVTFNDHGNEKNIYSDEFDTILDSLSELRYLKVSIQEPELYGINRSAMIELSAWGENTIRVQSVQESWAIGKAEALLRFAKGSERRLATQFRKFGLTVNLVITVCVLAAVPGLPTFGRRLAFVTGAFLIQALITQFHKRFVPNFVLNTQVGRAGLLSKIGPGFVSWGVNILGGVGAAIVYGLLKGELSDSPLAWLLNWLMR